MAAALGVQPGDLHVTRLGRRAILFAAAGLLCASHAGLSWSSGEVSAEAVSTYWRDKAFAPPRPDGDETAAPVPREQLDLFSRELQARIPIREATPFDLLDPGKGSLSAAPWWRVIDGPGYGSWPELSPATQAQPEAARQIMAQKIAALSAKFRGAPSRTLYAGRRKAAWNEEHGEHLVIAGPAVKEGVATYQAGTPGTRVRIPLFDGQLPARLFLWARTHGVTIRVTLRTVDEANDAGPELREAQFGEAQPLFIADAETDLPAWVVSSRGVTPARLTAFSTVGPGNGPGACSGSDWIELALDGDQQPAIWAVLVAPQTDLHKDAAVRRLPTRKDDERYGEAQRGEIELRWPDSIQPLRLVARRFDYIERTYDETPEGAFIEAGQRVLGSAWGVQIFDADEPQPKTSDQPPLLPLAASGSPRCAPP